MVFAPQFPTTQCSSGLQSGCVILAKHCRSCLAPRGIFFDWLCLKMAFFSPTIYGHVNGTKRLKTIQYGRIWVGFPLEFSTKTQQQKLARLQFIGNSSPKITENGLHDLCSALPKMKQLRWPDCRPVTACSKHSFYSMMFWINLL